MIKIAFSGVPGSGKSTLISEAKKLLGLKHSIEILEDGSGASPFEEDNNNSFINQFYHFSTQINDENKKSINNPEILFCDTAILDKWINWTRYTHSIGRKNSMAEKSQVLESIYRHWIKSYDIVFYIRVDQSVLETRIPDSDVSDQSAEDLLKLDELYLKQIKDDKLNVIEIWNNKEIDETLYKLAEKISDKLNSN